MVIGGDGSLHGALDLQHRGMPTVAVPATIDNDIAVTESTVGFDTAVNTVVQAIDHIRDTATSHERVYIIEVMGRLSGHIAAAAGLAAGAESILVPEVPLTSQQICERLERSYQRGKRHSIIVVCEGAGNGFAVGEQLQECTGHETRVTVLGYIQRGGSPTAPDRILASQMGALAVDLLRTGQEGRMVAWQRGRIVDVPLTEVVGQPHTFKQDLLELALILSI